MTKTLLFSKKIIIALITIALLVTFITLNVARSKAVSNFKGVFQVPTVIGAQIDYFLKLDGIDGESTDKGHKGELDIDSFSWGATNSGIIGGRGTGKVSVHDISMTKRIDKSSPSLMLYAVTGKHIKEAVLTVRKPGKDQQEFIKIKFTDVIISSYQIGSSVDIPTDSFSLNFAKIEFSVVGKDGSTNVTSFDFQQNR